MKGMCRMQGQSEPSGAQSAGSSAPHAVRNRFMLCLSAGSVALSYLMLQQSLDAPRAFAPLPVRAVRTASPTLHAAPPRVPPLFVVSRPSPAAKPTPTPTPTPTAAPAPVPPPKPSLPHSPPTRLEISQIGVDAPFTGLTLEDSGALGAPPGDDKNLVGWYQDGAAPGEIGTAVVAGHVDTKTGPAVFLRLSTLEPGSTVDITREDGIVATFSVDSVQAFPKADFPDQQVYDDASDAQLRLVTCGGTYDRKRKDYVDNVVVFAHLQSSRPK